jgi:predicted RNA-binding protein with PUA-like domain
MGYWLFKSEPDTFSIEDLAAAPRSSTSWEGVRNFQARNMLRDEVQRGDLAFFYHSSCAEPGIAGIVEVLRAGYPDASAWDRRSRYHDPKSPENKPLWYTVDVRLKEHWHSIVPLASLRAHADGELNGMLLLRRGNRLSITPVQAAHWKFILSLAR